jgi:hypothetical protein
MSFSRGTDDSVQSEGYSSTKPHHQRARAPVAVLCQTATQPAKAHAGSRVTRPPRSALEARLDAGAASAKESSRRPGERNYE